MCVALTSLKGGISQKNPDHRAVHRHSTHEVYTCTLNLIAARSRAGAYKPKVTPFLEYLGMSLAVRMRRPMGDCTRRFTEKVDIKKIEENSI